MRSRYLIQKDGKMYYLLRQEMEGKLIYSGWRRVYFSLYYDTVLDYYRRSGLGGDLLDEVEILEAFGEGVYGH